MCCIDIKTRINISYSGCLYKWLLPYHAGVAFQNPFSTVYEWKLLFGIFTSNLNASANGCLRILKHIETTTMFSTIAITHCLMALNHETHEWIVRVQPIHEVLIIGNSNNYIVK